MARSPGEKHLAAVSGSSNACCPMNADADRASPARPPVTAVQTHMHPHGNCRGHSCAADCRWASIAAATASRAERNVQNNAPPCVSTPTLRGCDSSSNRRVCRSTPPRSGHGRDAKQAGRTLDVSEQEGDRVCSWEVLPLAPHPVSNTQQPARLPTRLSAGPPSSHLNGLLIRRADGRLLVIRRRQAFLRIDLSSLANRRRGYSNASNSTDQVVPASGFTASEYVPAPSGTT